MLTFFQVQLPTTKFPCSPSLIYIYISFSLAQSPLLKLLIKIVQKLSNHFEVVILENERANIYDSDVKPA